MIKYEKAKYDFYHHFNDIWTEISWNHLWFSYFIDFTKYFQVRE